MANRRPEELICYLNRKPYRDKQGNLRQRWKCCGAKAKEQPCNLTRQPVGEISIAARQST